MIKLFRHIRKSLINQNQMGKYFKYAIGEIILVVIGILIALQINNWNENRKQEERITAYMRNLVGDLKSDIKLFDNNLYYYQKDIDESEFLITSDAYKSLEVDSILKIAIEVYNPDRTTKQTYEKMKNKGLIDLLGSEKINTAINDYYNVDLSFYGTLLQWDKEYTSKAYDFWLYNKNYEASSIRNYGINELPFLISVTQRKEDLITLIESIDGRNHIRNGLERKKHLVRRINEIKKRAKDLIEMLNQELDKR